MSEHEWHWDKRSKDFPYQSCIWCGRFADEVRANEEHGYIDCDGTETSEPDRSAWNAS